MLGLGSHRILWKVQEKLCFASEGMRWFETSLCLPMQLWIVCVDWRLVLADLGFC